GPRGHRRRAGAPRGGGAARRRPGAGAPGGAGAQPGRRPALRLRRRLRRGAGRGRGGGGGGDARRPAGAGGAGGARRGRPGGRPRHGGRRRAPRRRRGPAGDDDGGGERDVREPGRPGAALPARARRAGDGAAGLVGGGGGGGAAGPGRGPGHGGGRLRGAGRDGPGARRPRARHARPHGADARRRGGRAMTPEQKAWLFLTVVKLLVIFTLYMVTITYLTLLERKLAAWFQNRRGPNRVGPSGLLQPIADGIKAVLKQETLPAQAAKAVFVMAPAFAFIPALTLCALIPVAAPVHLSFDWALPLVGRMAWDGPLPMVVADVSAGFLLILAISSMGVYGIALAGWSSNSKYSLLG